MLASLRGRLVLSHILPLLAIIPLVGLALIYLIETTILLPSLARELQSEARLLAEVAGREDEIWQIPAEARALLTNAGPQSEARMMLINRQGQLLASNEAPQTTIENAPPNFELQPSDLTRVLNGERINEVRYSPGLGEEIIDVLVPVRAASGEILGLVRLSYHYGAVQNRFAALRYLVTGILALALAVGGLMGYWLAANIGDPLTRVTQSVHDLAEGQRSEPLAEAGPREVQRLQQAVNALFTRLRDLEKARQQLLANLVHELGRPLGALKSAIEALQGGALEQRDLTLELLQGMAGETNRLERLVNDLASLHNQILGVLELQTQPLELGSWLAHTLRPWEQAARKKRLRWQEHLPNNLPTLQADPERLGQALGNLLSNAIKFTPVGGTVTVAAGADQAWAWISVQDSGIGVPASEHDQIMKPFYRAETGQRFPQGLGLGLSITSDLIHAHQGRIELTSEPGRGSTFTLYLPLFHP